MFSLLEQLNIEFITQLSKTTFKWCNKYSYDFYIPSLNCIIETHGEQHYKETNRKTARNLLEEQCNDAIKKQLAKQNDIKYYIVINCSESESEYIINNVKNSELKSLFDLSQINWSKCEEFALSNLVKEVCELKRNNSNLTSMEIRKIIKLDKTTIIKYLKQGEKLGWCNYNSKEESFKANIKVGTILGKHVEIFKDGISLGVFPSCSELARQSEELFGVKLLNSPISSVCRFEKKSYKGFNFKYVDYSDK